MVPDNQLAREIQSKSIWGLGAEPQMGGVGGEGPPEPGGLGGRSFINMIQKILLRF